jgi:CCR4-NOT transcription complex subunit 1
MSQPFSWSLSSQRRGVLPEIQTASNSHPHSNNRTSSNPSNSPSRAAFSPTSASHYPSASSSSRHNVSRNSSVSSTSSPFSPSNPGVQQQSGNQLLYSARGRTIPSSAHSQLPSAVAAAQGGASSDGGSKPRLSRASPSLSQSSDIGSPQPQSATSAPFSASGGVASIDIAQVSIQLARLDKEKDPQKLDEGIRSLGAVCSRPNLMTA